jgi:hypothetical protein
VLLDEVLDWTDLWAAARELLRANYDLSDGEIARLLDIAPGPDGQALATDLVHALFGPSRSDKTYSRWVRASLLANGIGNTEVSADDLSHVLAILVATNRTVPLSKFADACRLLDERARLEALI